jgi:transcriptional regulator GlxA family with amidase domain
MFFASPDPLDLEVLVVPDATLILTASVLEPLRAANRILGRRHYRWSISTPDGKPVMTTSGIPIPADRAFEAGSSSAPLIVVASYHVTAHMTRDLIRRIGAARRSRPAIGGVESGVWLLAEAGLLNGAAATAHWEDMEEFGARYPDVKLRRESFVVDGKRFTAGGASPTLDMMLHLIRMRQGYPLALNVSKLFIYEASGRMDAAPQPSLGQLIQSDARVATAVREMDAHLDRPLSIEDIAARAGVSARHLQSLFIEALGVAPKDYYLSLRLNLARRQVIETHRPLADVAAAAGFAHPAVFTRAYARIYGETPAATRRGPA